MVLTDTPLDLIMKDNQAKGITLGNGFDALTTKLVKNAKNMWNINGKETIPFWFKEKTGPFWQKIKFSGTVK